MRLIQAGGDIVAEVAAILGNEGADWSRSAVIFQGKRPGHFLRKAIAHQVGGSFLPPQLFSIDQFVDHVFGVLLGHEEPLLHAMDAAGMLYEIHKDTGRQFGGGAFAELQDFLPLARHLFGALEELAMAEVTPRVFVAAAEAVGLEHAALLGTFYETFYAHALASGRSTRATRYRAVADEMPAVPGDRFTRIIVAGFFGFTGTERRIMQALHRRPETIFVIQDGPGIRQRMEQIGLFLPADAIASPGRGARISFYRSADTHDEVFGLARKVQEAIDSGVALDEHTVIVLPSPDALFPVVHWVVPLLRGADHNISLGYPGGRTSVAGFLASLLQLAATRNEDRLFAPDYIRFMLHPYTKNIRRGMRSDLTRTLVHAIEDRLVRAKGMTYFTLEELESDYTLFGASGGGEARAHLVEIHDRTIRAFLSARSVGECAQRLIEVLTYISERSTAHRHRLFGPFMLAIIDELEILAASSLGPMDLGDPSHYAAIVRNCLADAMVPFQGTPLKGLQVLGFLETRNLRFRTVYLLDANDDVLPGASEPDLFLPPAVRAIVGLPGLIEREEIVAYHLHQLLAGAEEVHLFFREGGKKEKSRFVEALLWERQQADGVMDTSRYVQQISHSIRLVNQPPKSEQKDAETCRFLREMAYSATALDRYLRCPLLFHHAHLLGLQEREEVDAEINRAGIGRFVHKVLAVLFRPWVGRSLDPAGLREEDLAQTVDAMFREEYGGDPAGSRYLLREQVKRQLAIYLAAYRREVLAHEQVQILGIEQPLEMTRADIRIKGFADRIERRGRKLVILDFKTGGDETRLAIRFSKLDPARRETYRRAIGSLQLPLYQMLCADAFHEPVEAIHPAYVMLGKVTLSGVNESPLFGPGEDVGVHSVALAQVVERLLAEIISPDLPFTPAEDLAAACPGCSFTAICGTQWVSGWHRPG